MGDYTFSKQLGLGRRGGMPRTQVTTAQAPTQTMLDARRMLSTHTQDKCVGAKPLFRCSEDGIFELQGPGF